MCVIDTAALNQSMHIILYIQRRQHQDQKINKYNKTHITTVIINFNFQVMLDGSGP